MAMHGTTDQAASGAVRAGGDEERFDLEQLTRVEGEGALHLRLAGGRVVEAHLSIFEAPRYFERLVIGRTPDEVIDIVARVCGICPVAYQMTAVHAFEDLFGIVVDPAVVALRRLLYCGEWIESHALHIYLLHAPDFLGYESGIELARDHRRIVERGLALKRTGNRILALLGGRPIHPVSVRVGGFSRVPSRGSLAELGPDLDAAVEAARTTVAWAATLPAPDFQEPVRLVALRHPQQYPMNQGRIASTDGLDLDPAGWEQAFGEEQVAWSTALQGRAHDGAAYLLGPAARITLDAAQLHPLAAEALAATGLSEEIATNPFRSIVARSVELLHAVAEARDLVAGYQPPATPQVSWSARPGQAAWATEAPRGLLFHRYAVDEEGVVGEARIVPPTSQNQTAIEAATAAFAPTVLDLPREETTNRLEQLIRSYDPCISCAAHFLDLRLEEV
jgi:coenzyme F420-reducing hydrogenase alpha subunit